MTSLLQRLGDLSRAALAAHGVNALVMGVVAMSPALSTLADAPEKRSRSGTWTAWQTRFPPSSARRRNRWLQSWTQAYSTGRW